MFAVLKLLGLKALQSSAWAAYIGFFCLNNKVICVEEEELRRLSDSDLFL